MVRSIVLLICLAAAIESYVDAADCVPTDIKTSKANNLACCGKDKKLKIFKSEATTCKAFSKGSGFVTDLKTSELFPKGVFNVANVDADLDKLLLPSCYADCYFKELGWVNKDETYNYTMIKNSILSTLNETAKNATFTSIVANATDTCKDYAMQFLPATICKLTLMCRTEAMAFTQCLLTTLTPYCASGVKTADKNCLNNVNKIQACSSKMFTTTTTTTTTTAKPPPPPPPPPPSK